MARSILWFKEIHKDDLEIVGNRGVELGEMVNAGYPVPDGFVITSDAYFSFLHQNKLITKINGLLSTVNFEYPDSVSQVSANIKKIFVHASFSEEFTNEIYNSYRKLSGALKDTPVNIFLESKSKPLYKEPRGEAGHSLVSGEANLILEIKKAWATHFDPREFLSRHEKKIDHFRDGVSLVIQKAIKSEISGTVLTANPVNNNTSKIIIEVNGSGEHYEVLKNSLQIINLIVEKKPILTDKQVIELAALGKNLEKHLYFAQEIQWGIEKKKIYILRHRQLSLNSKNVRDTSYISSSLKLAAKGVGVSGGLATGHVKIINELKDFNKIFPGDVIVATVVPKSHLSAIKKAAAIILEDGGRTTHAAIIARDFGVPVISGIKNAVKILKQGQIVSVNGNRGEVYSHTDHFPKPTTATKIYLNIQANSLDDNLSHDYSDGTIIEELPIKELEEKLMKVCKKFAPRPVIYKLFDYDEDQSNRFGFRGIHRAINSSEFFEKELFIVKEIRERKNLKNLWILLPFVRNVKELLHAKEIIKNARLHRDASFKIWITIATPASVINLDELVKTGIDGVYIDLDELTTLFTGVDDKISEVAHIFDPLDPAVLWALEKIIKTTHAHGMTSTIAGKFLSHHPSLIDKLVRFGVSNIAVPHDLIDVTRQNIANSEIKLVEYQ